MMLNVPYIYENTRGGERANDIFSRLLADRIIMLSGEVNEDTALLVTSQLLYLDSISHEPITLYVNSVGGVCTDGLSIIDVMRHIASPVHTVSMGLSASMGAVILACGDKRYSLENSEIMVHQPLGGAWGQCSDIQIQAESILKMKVKLTKMLADNSLLTYEEMEKMCDRDCYLSAQEALEIGLIDSIIKPHKTKR